MAKLNDDEKKLLEELQARASAPDEDDDFEIEVYDTTAGKGARIPYRSGKGWLFDTFGIGKGPDSREEAGGVGGPGGDAPPAGSADTEGKPGYFGRKA